MIILRQVTKYSHDGNVALRNNIQQQPPTVYAFIAQNQARGLRNIRDNPAQIPEASTQIMALVSTGWWESEHGSNPAWRPPASLQNPVVW